MDEQADEQHEKQTPVKRYDWLKGYRFVKGVSGNPNGRPKGSKSLKTFAREYLETLPEDEKVEFLKTLPADLVWRMAEGNPSEEKKLNIDATVTAARLSQGQIDQINKIALDQDEPQTQAP